MFSTAELRWAQLQIALNQNKMSSSAFLYSSRSIYEANTDSGAADRHSAQKSIVLQQLNQPVPELWANTHKQTHAERLGVFIAHLSCYRVICGCRLFMHLAPSHCAHVHPKSKTKRDISFLPSLNHNLEMFSPLHMKIIISKKQKISWLQHKALRKVKLNIRKSLQAPLFHDWLEQV